MEGYDLIPHVYTTSTTSAATQDILYQWVDELNARKRAEELQREESRICRRFREQSVLFEAALKRIWNLAVSMGGLPIERVDFPSIVAQLVEIADEWWDKPPAPCGDCPACLKVAASEEFAGLALASHEEQMRTRCPHGWSYGTACPSCPGGRANRDSWWGW